jgi:hypothetical protein
VHREYKRRTVGPGCTAEKVNKGKYNYVHSISHSSGSLSRPYFRRSKRRSRIRTRDPNVRPVRNCGRRKMGSSRNKVYCRFHKSLLPTGPNPFQRNPVPTLKETAQWLRSAQFSSSGLGSARLGSARLGSARLSSVSSLLQRAPAGAALVPIL